MGDHLGCRGGFVVERGRDHITPGEECLLVVHGLLVVVPGEDPVGDLGRKAPGDAAVAKDPV